MICVSRAVLLIPSCLVAKLFSEPTHELTSIQAITDDNFNFLEFTKHIHHGHALIWLLEHQWERHYYSYFAAEEGWFAVSQGISRIWGFSDWRSHPPQGCHNHVVLLRQGALKRRAQRELTSSSSPGSSTSKWRVFRSLGDCGRPQDSCHSSGVGLLAAKIDSLFKL